jgi:formate dehydrogenase subunit beta
LSAKGDLLHIWASDPLIREKGESGGAVTALLKFALEEGIVDAVLGVKKGADISDARPVFITDPNEVAETAGSIYGGTLLLSKLFGKYLNGAKDLKIAAALKGCDVMGVYEQAKRDLLNLDNVLMVGLNCGGSITPAMMRRIVTEIFDEDPYSVEKEAMYKGRFHIDYDGQHKDFPIKELEERGYGRRSNCRRCKMKIPRQADLACGQWGVRKDLVGRATFVEVCSGRGADLVNRALEAGAVGTDIPDDACIKARKRRENAILNLADIWRERDFTPLSTSRERLKRMMEETSRCIKCYTCIEVCPALFNTIKPYVTSFPGKVPPEFGFHLLRYSHVADSCIDCGQCEELCPVDIPNALFMHAIEADLEALYGYHAGEDMSRPVAAIMEEPDVMLLKPVDEISQRRYDDKACLIRDEDIEF